MIHYFPVNTFEIGNLCVLALFDVMRPAHTRGIGESPFTNGTVYTHPISGLFRFSLHEGLYPCHAESDENILDSFFQPFVIATDITAQEVIDFQDAVIAAKVSGQLDIWDNLPNYFATESIDDAQMELDGWFD